jgi:secreted PhoX family phosphatase
MPTGKKGVSVDLDDSENVSTNPTDNPTFKDIARAGLSRRRIMQGSLAAAATSFLAPAPAMARGPYGGKSDQPLVGFDPLTIEDATAFGGKTVTISSDYTYQVLIPWGTPIDPNSGVPTFDGDPDNRPTAAEAEQQIGIGHDGMWFYPSNLPRVLETEMKRGEMLPAQARSKVLDSNAGMLAINHEFGSNGHVFGYLQDEDGNFILDDDGDKIEIPPQSLEDVRLSQAVHGVAVVAIAKGRSGLWEVVSNPNSRRITVNTPMAVSGPVAGSPLLANPAGNQPMGTVNNCGSGATPWGTYLTCEENFNGYFGSSGSLDGFDDLQKAGYARYGFSAGGFGYQWHVYDERFDVSKEAYKNESNRFGWCVEIDPFSTDIPVKRTALGRFKHEAVAFKELADGRIAVYMGDDQRGDYCYKYESDRPWRESIADDESPLDDGKLYVAVFHGDTDLSAGDGKGVGEWVELTHTDPRIANVGLDSQDKVLTYARIAADAVGATKMDRPEWTTIGTEGEVYWTLTNHNRKNAAVPVNEVNPIFDNEDGSIIRTDDTSSTSFVWNVYILARNTRATDPMHDNPELDFDFAAYTSPADGGENTFTDPDACWADPFGRLFIGTDGGQPAGLQDQMVVFDVATGEYRRLLMGVNSDEITGITTTPDYRTLFTNTQHPGDGDPEATNFPAPYDGRTIPRDCTLVVVRKDGGVVGS